MNNLRSIRSLVDFLLQSNWGIFMNIHDGISPNISKCVIGAVQCTPE